MRKKATYLGSPRTRSPQRQKWTKVVHGLKLTQRFKNEEEIKEKNTTETNLKKIEQSNLQTENIDIKGNEINDLEANLSKSPDKSIYL